MGVWATIGKPAVVLALVLFLLWTVTTCRITSFPEEDGFMEPTIKSKELIKLKKDRSAVRRGVVVQYEIKGKSYFGRVLATEGDVLSMDADSTVVNGSPLGEAYVGNKRGFGDVLDATLIPIGHMYVVHDNRRATGSADTDSRLLGPIPIRAVIGVWKGN